MYFTLDHMKCAGLIYKLHEPAPGCAGDSGLELFLAGNGHGGGRTSAGQSLRGFSMPPRSLDTACWSMRSGAREERTPDSRQSQLFSCSPVYGMRPWDDSPSCDLSRCAPLSSETQSQVKEKINHGFIPAQPLSLRGNQPFPCFLQPLLQTKTHKTDGWDFKARTQGDYLSFLLVPFKIKQHNEYINGTIPSLSLTKSLSW